MRFGIFYEHQLPRPWDDGAELRLVQDALDQVELADRLGIDYVWEVEHHFLEEYSHSSAPEVFLAAASQRTRDIRLGHGIIQTAPQYNHPVRTAERLAMLDLVSGGRVEFGSGESSSTAELGGFGIDPAQARCMARGPRGHHPVHDRIAVHRRRRHVREGATAQRRSQARAEAHPPLWVACSRRETILLAAQHGIGALTFAFIDPEEAVHWVGDYERTLAESCVPIGHAVNPEVACVTTMMCHHDEREAIARGLEGGNFFGYSLAHYYVFGDHRPGRTNVWEEFQNKRAERGYDPEVAVALEQETLGAKVAAGETEGLRGAIGTPGQLREFLRRYEEVGVDQIIFVMQAGRNRHEHIMESLELFGAEVLPEFKARDEKLRAAKAARLEPVIEAAMARRVEPDVSMPDDYVMEALPKQLIKAVGGDELLETIAANTSVGDRSHLEGLAAREV